MSGNWENEKEGANPADGGGDVQLKMRLSSASNAVLLSGYDEVRRIVAEGSMQASRVPCCFTGDESNVLLLAIGLLK